MYKLVVALILFALPVAAQRNATSTTAGDGTVELTVDIFTASNSTHFDTTTAPTLIINVMDGYSVRILPAIHNLFAPGGKVSMTVKMPVELDTIKAISITYDAGQRKPDWIFRQLVLKRGKYPPVVCGAKDAEKDRTFSALMARTIIC